MLIICAIQKGARGRAAGLPCQRKVGRRSYEAIAKLNSSRVSVLATNHIPFRFGLFLTRRILSSHPHQCPHQYQNTISFRIRKFDVTPAASTGPYSPQPYKEPAQIPISIMAYSSSSSSYNDRGKFNLLDQLNQKNIQRNLQNQFDNTGYIEPVKMPDGRPGTFGRFYNLRLEKEALLTRRIQSREASTFTPRTRGRPSSSPLPFSFPGRYTSGKHCTQRPSLTGIRLQEACNPWPFRANKTSSQPLQVMEGDVPLPLLRRALRSRLRR